MNDFNESLKATIKEKGIPDTLVMRFIFKDDDSVTFSFPINGDEISIDLEAQVERVEESTIYKITEEKLSVLVKYFEGLTL